MVLIVGLVAVILYLVLSFIIWITNYNKLCEVKDLIDNIKDEHKILFYKYKYLENITELGDVYDIVSKYSIGKIKVSDIKTSTSKKEGQEPVTSLIISFKGMIEGYMKITSYGGFSIKVADGNKKEALNYLLDIKVALKNYLEVYG